MSPRTCNIFAVLLKDKRWAKLGGTVCSGKGHKRRVGEKELQPSPGPQRPGLISKAEGCKAHGLHVPRVLRAQNADGYRTGAARCERERTVCCGGVKHTSGYHHRMSVAWALGCERIQQPLFPTVPFPRVLKRSIHGQLRTPYAEMRSGYASILLCHD